MIPKILPSAFDDLEKGRNFYDSARTKELEHIFWKPFLQKLNLLESMRVSMERNLDFTGYWYPNSPMQYIIL